MNQTLSYATDGVRAHRVRKPLRPCSIPPYKAPSTPLLPSRRLRYPGHLFFFLALSGLVMLHPTGAGAIHATAPVCSSAPPPEVARCRISTRMRVGRRARHSSHILISASLRRYPWHVRSAAASCSRRSVVSCTDASGDAGCNLAPAREAARMRFGTQVHTREGIAARRSFQAAHRSAHESAYGAFRKGCFPHSTFSFRAVSGRALVGDVVTAWSRIARPSGTMLASARRSQLASPSIEMHRNRPAPTENAGLATSDTGIAFFRQPLRRRATLRTMWAP